ncbi:thioredoxin domain-containing protein [uncultured Bacteroides sp.]|uniref:thioredoxin family protein n=1 Tax=uncultured Bacteroides sp. TaxID=162156 RepID=UPI00262F1739|nr:thioredoxin domain-containing protein [uncultured Bacteroides sp.]
MAIVHLTKEEFAERIIDYKAAPDARKYKGNKPAVVDFFATWCNPCKALSPIFEELAEQFGDRIDFYKIDVDKEEEVYDAFKIRMIPTLLWLPIGKPYSLELGVMGKADLKKKIEENLLK